MYHPSLFHTDLYELTMGQSYFNNNKRNHKATFELFFRKQPFNGGYTVFCGRNGIYNFIQNLEQSIEDFKSLLGGDKKAKDYFINNFSFTEAYTDYLLNDLVKDIRELEILTVEEGEIVFENTPIVQVSGKLLPMQIIETPLLQIVNSQTIIATKTARIKNAAGNRILSEFGLRRSHNPNLTYAAIVGGADSTSNVLVGAECNFKTIGTVAHSYIMSFGSTSEDEYRAFCEYADTFPNNYLFLVDTFDIEQGIENAIKVAKERNDNGFRGIRIDSGDLCYWAVKARKMLDDAGFKKALIVASNDLDEYLIQSMDNQAIKDYNLKRVPIDVFGVGTRLITAYDQPALGAVYKIVEIYNPDFNYVIKVSANTEKTTIPGKKKLYRYINEKGQYEIDFIALADEVFESKIKIIHKDFENIFTKVDLNKGKIVELLKPLDFTPLEKINVCENLKKLPKWHERLENPHIYHVGLSEKLFNLRQKMIKDVLDNSG